MAYRPSSEEEAQFLKNYDASRYQNPAVAADTVLFALDGERLKLLLIRRGNHPYKGFWALPGGFVELDEDLPDAARRELWEETGLSGIYLEQVFCWGRPGRDPRQRVITVSFMGLSDTAALRPRAGDDAADAKWFVLSDYAARDEGGHTTLSYTLSSAETLRPVVGYPAGCSQQITAVDSGGLAFDHAESIAYAYACLRQRADSGFLEMAFEDENTRRRARRIIME